MKIKIYRTEGVAVGAAFEDETVVSVEVDASSVIGDATAPESFSQQIVVNTGTDVIATSVPVETVEAPVEETEVVDTPVETTPVEEVPVESVPVETPADTTPTE